MKVKSTQIFMMIEFQKEGSHCICLSAILIDFALKIGKNYYPQVFLECKYTIKEKKVSRFTDDDLEICSDDFDEENSNKSL